MKAAVYYHTGLPDVLKYEEVPDPALHPRGVIVDVQAIGIEGGDVLNRAGGDMPSKPHIVGYNCAGVIREVGVELPRTQIATQFDGVNIQLYFHPLVDHPDIKLNAFVHMSTRGGEVHAQRDLMGIPALQWTRDLVFIQDNFVIAGTTSPGSYIITLGVYEYATGERLPILNTAGDRIADRLVVGRVQVVEQE